MNMQTEPYAPLQYYLLFSLPSSPFIIRASRSVAEVDATAYSLAKANEVSLN